MIAHSVTRSEAEKRFLKRPKGSTLLEMVIVIIIALIVLAFLLPATRSAGPASHRSQCKNNLKQIGLALHNYADVYGALPPAYTVDENGKPLHSWRTLILPYLDKAPLYNAIDLSKPWDHPANAKAYEADIPVYRCPTATCPENHTTYLAVVTPRSCLRPAESRPWSEIAADSRETVMVIEADAQQSVHWMSPRDADESLVLGLGPEKDLPHSDGVNGLFVDGAVWFLDAEMSVAERRARISATGIEEAADSE